MHIIYELQNFRYSTLCELTSLVYGGSPGYKDFVILTSDVFISNITSVVVNQKYLNVSYILLSSTLIHLNLKMQNFRNLYHPKLEIDSNIKFSKNEYFKNVNFLIIFSVSYNNVVVTKQIWFSPIYKNTALHLW